METYKKITNVLPTKKGKFATNFGELYFDGKTFGFPQKSANGGQFTPTVVEWWLELVELPKAKMVVA